MTEETEFSKEVLQEYGIFTSCNKCVAQQLALSYATRSYVRKEGEHVGTKLAKELLDWGTFRHDDKLTAVVVSGSLDRKSVV